MENINLLTIFGTGLLIGGLTCMAVQGGLLAATIAQREQDRLKEELSKVPSRSSGLTHSLPILAFLVAKLSAYTAFGFVLGWFGSLFQLSVTTQVILQIAVGIFMIGTALNLLEVHPVFRYFVIQPPRFLTRLIRRESKSKAIFAPALLGAFTIFIPCGTTQAMMALAVASANPLMGAAILFVFVLGTSPLFFVLGYFATRLKDTFQKPFLKIAAYALIVLAVFNLNNAVALSGSRLTLDVIAKNVYCIFSICDDSPFLASAVDKNESSEPVSNATIKLQASGYSPNRLVVRSGSNVTLTLVNDGGAGCIQAFTIPSLNIQKIVPLGKEETVTFQAPSKPQDLAFMCSMGMFRGTIQVI